MSMLLPPKIISLIAKYKSPRTHPIVMIVAHATVGWDSRSYLQNGGGITRKVSCHCLVQKFPRAVKDTVDVGDGTFLGNGAVVYRMVPDNMVANHAGFSTARVNGITYHPNGINVNQVSLGVEIENLQNGNDPYSEDQLLAFGWVCWNWRNLWGPIPVLRHGDIDPTRRSDPIGLSVESIEYWIDQAGKLVMSDKWLLWGNRFPLRKEWAIPKAWYNRAEALGMPLTDEIYPNISFPFSVQFFERGVCIYSGKVNKARALLYTEI